MQQRLFPPIAYSLLLSISLSLLLSTSNAETPKPQLIPQAATETAQAYQPQAILPGGQVLTLFPPDSPLLDQKRIHKAEVYTMTKGVPGRVQKIVDIHNPSIEFHPVEKNANTGATVILIPGGGHKSLNVGPAGIDFVSYFYNYGINTVILRNRLRNDGYNAEIDAVNDALQAIRVVRSHSKEWDIDPKKIGVMGFSAGGELASASALFYDKFNASHGGSSDPLGSVSSRPDFVGLIFTGPSALTREPNMTFPRDIPPVFIAGASYGDARHTTWATDYFLAMLNKGVPNIELHSYGNGGHGGGMRDRGGIPFGSWEARFIDWFRDLGFLQKPGIPTQAAIDIQTYLNQ